MQNFKIIKEINNIGAIKQYLIESDSKNYILSHAKTEGSNNVILRACEVMKAVSNLVNTPKVIDCWSKCEDSYLIEECLEGRSITCETITKEDVEQIVISLKKLHSIKCENTIDKCLILAKMHMDSGLLNKNDFIIDGKETAPEEVFNYLVKNKDVFKDCCLLHGDLCLKNIVKTKNNKYYFTNWFNCVYGDFYYDLASIMWNLSGENNKALFEFYGEKEVDGKRLLYADYLSKFLKIS